MELAHLRALVAVGQFANLSRASEQLHLSPPAVFAHIRQLEEEVGEKLYERAGKTLTLTVPGRVLLAYAKRILREHDDALIAVKESSDLRRGYLRFGCGPHTSMCIVPHLMRVFLADYPQVQINNFTGDRPTQLRDLREGRLDLLLTLLEDEPKDLETVPLWAHERVVVVPPSDPLAARRRIEAADLRDRRFILPRGPGTEEALRQFRVELGFEPQVAMVHDQAGAIAELVSLGIGVSILPLWSVAGAARDRKLKLLRLKAQPLVDRMGLIHRRLPNTLLRTFAAAAARWREWLPIAHYLIPLETPAAEPTVPAIRRTAGRRAS